MTLDRQNPLFVHGDEVIVTTPEDPRALPLIKALIHEYDSRYGDFLGPEGAAAELYRYPPEDFVAPNGAFLLVLRDGETIGGGAFMRHGSDTAEFKRIWTDDRFRRQGLARGIVRALEVQAQLQGYKRVYLTTGFRQPEAVALYLSLDYTALFDTTVDPEIIEKLPFEKWIAGRAPRAWPQRSRAHTLDQPSATAARAGRETGRAVPADESPPP
jgi:GNAT superfamily N-acetyltransferase